MKFSSFITGALTACVLTTTASAASGYTNGTTTLAPVSKSASTITELTTDGDLTSTVTLLTTITYAPTTTASAASSSDGSAASDGTLDLNRKDGQLGSTSSTDMWSTLTSTLYVTQEVTMSGASGSNSNAVSTSTSAYEKIIVIGTSTPACVPQTVTVTQYQATQYVTVTAGQSTSSAGPIISSNSAIFSNQTTY
ncbi:LAMI_0F04060g1_1 [Lachancea mirantina]|uniref:LAMI_0F04060g1_1 n=1 Tax=Lachancea mirantina TaxID=1230905 RepID=A0A1G4JXK4_9SACH|nr:LAMI_0F04060g1_1 [Lachancea mirantina]